MPHQFPRHHPRHRLSALAEEQADIPESAYERMVFRTVMSNALDNASFDARQQRRSADELCEWFEKYGPALEIKAPFGEDATPMQIKTGLARLKRTLNKTPTARRKSSMQVRLDWIASTLALTKPEADILALTVRIVVNQPLHAFLAAVSSERMSDGEVDAKCLALASGVSASSVRRHVRQSAPLFQLGLLEDCGAEDFAPSRLVRQLCGLRTTNTDTLRDALLGTSTPTTLGWDDFDHMTEDRDLALSVLQAAIRDGKPGVNVLLYGEPGTGKTEFAKVLADKLEARAVFVGEMDEEGAEPTRYERIAHFALASKLAARAGRTLLVVDEADDVFAGIDDQSGRNRRGSKVFMNRLVENTQAPTLWITNETGHLGQAIMRRMSLAIRFDRPGKAQRRRMVERMSERHDLNLPAPDLDRLASMKIAPALLDAGLRAAHLTDGRVATAERASQSLARAVDGQTPPPVAKTPTPFDPTLSSADTDLKQLADKVEQAGLAPMSFLLTGAPGTGKSAYARYLADRIGIEVMHRRASDLMSMYVGGTEQAIAEAFATAREQKAMLLIDEADSMLASRGGAVRSWEVSQVNEMLTWMESHPLPFAMTTNAPLSGPAGGAGGLDPAALRRFTFKVGFQPMNAAQIETLFKRLFGVAPPKTLLRETLLTPGDFATVERKAKVLGEKDATILAQWLKAECAAKPEAGLRDMGFLH